MDQEAGDARMMPEYETVSPPFAAPELGRVLIVAANPETHATLAGQLTAAGVDPAHVQATASADEGIRTCRLDKAARPGLVLLALNLAGAQGSEWLLKARTRGACAAVPTLLVGYDRDEDDPRIDTALAAGAQGFIALDTMNPHHLRRSLRRAVSCHQAVQQLAASDAHYRELALGAPDLLWVSDLSSACTFVNKMWLDYTGRPAEEELGDRWQSGVHPEDRDLLLREYGAAFAARQPFEVEFRLRRHDGTYRWMLNRARPRFDPDGSFVGFAGSCIDVTPLRSALDELRVNEARIRSVLQIAGVAAATVDRDLRYTWVYNAQPEYSQQDLVGRRDDELAPETSGPFLAFKQEALAQEQPLRRKLELRTAQGAYHVLDVTAEPLLDAQGQVAGLTVVSMDITQHELERNRARFLAEASELLNASLDYNSTLRQIAAALVPNMADWCSVDLVNKEGGIDQVVVAHVDPAKVEWAKELRRQNPPALDDPAGLPAVIRTGKPEFYPDITWEMIMAGGPSEEDLEILRKINFRSMIIVPLMARGSVLGALTLVWTDSDRHYDAEDLTFAQELARRAGMAIDNAQLYADAQARAHELHQLSATLEQRVQERTRELVRSNQDLDQFAYVASHDLKAPLRAIDHLSTWIVEDAGHLLPARSREHLEKMRGRIKRMEGLLDDLLAYSRAGRQHGEPDWVDLDELVMRAVETVSPPAGFKVELAGDLPTIYTRHVPLETVIRNLVGNAIKHHDRDEGHVLISAAHAPELVTITVQDDGPGIEPAYYDRIFQMFQTLRPRDQVEGSGIGLSVVKKIVEGNDGTIAVSPAPGRGTRFTFTWPYRLPAE